MSHHACDNSPSKVGTVKAVKDPQHYEYEEMHWADKSTPLLGRRNKRSTSPPNSDDEQDGTLSILPPPIKRAKTLKRGGDCQKS